MKTMLDRFCEEDDMEHDPTVNRNREPSEPDSNMNIDEGEAAAQPQQEDNDEMGEDDAFEDDEEFGTQEYSALNNQLDQLQSALDSLESRNDDIHSKLLELLRSSREIRQVMIEENSLESGEGNNAPPMEDSRGEGGSAASSSNSIAPHDKGSPNESMEGIPVKKSE